jgi:hypothetical protein
MHEEYYRLEFIYKKSPEHITGLTLKKNTFQLSRIWGFHGGEYEDGCLLGCSAV